MEGDGPTTRVVGQGLGEAVLRRPLSATIIGGQVSGGTATLVTVPEHRIKFKGQCAVITKRCRQGYKPPQHPGHR